MNTKKSGRFTEFFIYGYKIQVLGIERAPLTYPCVFSTSFNLLQVKYEPEKQNQSFQKANTSK